MPLTIESISDNVRKNGGERYYPEMEETAQALRRLKAEKQRIQDYANYKPKNHIPLCNWELVFCLIILASIWTGIALMIWRFWD